MKLGRLELRHTFLGETDYVIIRWFKTSVPLTQASGMVNGVTVTQVVYPAPHSEESLLIEDLDPVMYDVKSYRSADGINIDTQIFTLAGDAGARAAYSTTTFTYVVDRGESGTDPDWIDPSSGTVELRDERLLDGEYLVEKRGLGKLVPPTETAPEYTDRSDAGGGFDLIPPYGQFEADDTYFVTLQNRVDGIDSGSGSGSGSGSEVSDVLILDEDQDFDIDTMNAKLLFVDYPGAGIGVLTFQNLSLLADCSFKLSTHGGNQTFFQLQLDAGDTVRFFGEDKNVITLGKSEEISIMIRNNTMYVLPGTKTGYDKLGQRIWGDKLEQNTLYRDGSTYDQDDYPRLMEFIDSLPGAQVVSYATWATDKSKFARDDVAGTFKVPDSRTKFVRGVSATDGSVVPGISQTDLIKQFWTGTFTTLNILKVDGTNTEIGTDPNVGNPNIRFGVEVDQTLFGSETRPINESLLPLICV